MSDIAFAGARLDRADSIRANPEALARLTDWRARLFPLDQLAPRLDQHNRIAWTSLADADPDSELVFLGLLDERACFAAVPPAGRGDVGPPPPNIWSAMTLMSPDELAVYGAARSLVDWHSRHRFCARCGHGTTLQKGGWQRDCVNQACNAQHFPRVDPVTIMTVEHDGDLLLGRQPRFAPRSYSALAGFVEPGESIEEAVAREVFEEAGVRVREVRYVASQPWPFPSSLMIGCHAFAENREIVVDTTELEDARWFTRAQIAEAFEAATRGEQGEALGLPPRHAIAHHIIAAWLGVR